MAIKAKHFDLLLGQLFEDGVAMAGGSIEFYQNNSLVPKNVYSDAEKTTSLGASITLNSYGSRLGGTHVYLDGFYRIKIKDSDGNTLDTIDSVGESNILDGSVDASNYASLNLAAADIGTTDEVDLIITNSISMTASLNFATTYDNIRLRILRGGEITGAYTLTVPNSNLDAGEYQIFSSTLTVEGLSVAYVEWWGPDGTADDIEINKAITAVKDTLEGAHTEGLTAGKSGQVLLDLKAYTLNAPVKIYTGVRLLGKGYGTKLQEGTFVGTELVQLSKIGTGIGHLEIANMELKGTTAGLAAIRLEDESTGARGFWIHDLIINTADGLRFESTNDSGGGVLNSVIERIYSVGTINYVIYISGNMNKLSHIDKEGESTADAGAFIKIGGDATYASNGWILENITIEQTGSVNKHAIDLNNVENVIINNVHLECVDTDGYWLKATDSKFINIFGLNGTTQPDGKISLVNSQYVYIDKFETESDYNLANYVEIDNQSDMEIGTLWGHSSGNYRLLSEPNLVVRKIIDSNIISANPAGYVQVNNQKHISGQNLLVNGSFEAGVYGWAHSTIPATTNEYIQSAIGNGLMAHFKWDANGAHTFTQVITVPAAWVGQTLTLSTLAKITGTATAMVIPFIDGAGITSATAYGRLMAGSGWGIVSQTFTIQSASNITVGFYINIVTNANDEVWLDEATLAFGTENLLGAGRFAQVEIGSGAGNTITTGTAAPSTGTWKRGDIVFRSDATASQAAGWVCTGAGSPGTWKALASLAA